jgi:hypothetical protein
MEVFPFVFYHQLEPVDRCFEDSYEGLLSDFVENVGDRPFYAPQVREAVFGEFSIGIAKEEEVIWCEVGAVSPARYPLDRFCVKLFNGSPCIIGTCIVWVDV